MISQKRLIKIEMGLTPKQAVLLWFRQEYQGKTSDQIINLLLQNPLSSAPRPKVARLVESSVRQAMKGHAADLIQTALRQGQMEADFLVLLVNRVNADIIDTGRERRLHLMLLHERLRVCSLSEDEPKALFKWAAHVRRFAVEIFAVRAATQLIQDKFFDGERVLLSDVMNELHFEIKLTESLITAYDRVMCSAGRPGFAIESGKFRKGIQKQASEKAECIVAIAKSSMLDDFGETDAAERILRSHMLKSIQQNLGQSTSFLTT
jgi:hypothetical protein